MINTIILSKENFIIDLGFDLPSDQVSKGAKWHVACEHRTVMDCMENRRYIFRDIEPQNYESYTQYTAAYQLCRYAAGIDREDTLENTFISMALCKAVIFSDSNSPLHYYDCFHHRYLYLLALNTCSKWSGQFVKQSDLSDVFYELNKRSHVQVIDAFTWLYGFFYDLSCKVYATNSHELSDAIMWLSPEIHIALSPLLPICLTSDMFGVSNRHLSELSACAAGLYRMDEKDIAKSIYCWCFETADKSNLSVDNKRLIVSSFMDRLERGYGEKISGVDLEWIDLLKSNILCFKNKQWVQSQLVVFQIMYCNVCNLYWENQPSQTPDCCI